MEYSFEKFTEDSGDDYPKYGECFLLPTQQVKENNDQLEFSFIKDLEIKNKKVSDKQ